MFLLREVFLDRHQEFRLCGSLYESRRFFVQLIDLHISLAHNDRPDQDLIHRIPEIGEDQWGILVRVRLF